MDTNTQHLSRYLRGAAGERRNGEPAAPAPFITISRQAGAGATTLAEALLAAMAGRPGEKLWRGWQVFDRNLCEAVARDPALSVSLDSLLSERQRGAIEDAFASAFAHFSPQMNIDLKMFQVAQSVAAVGRAVIVGRGACCVTRCFELGVHVRLVAPEDLRVRRASRRFGLSPADAERWVRDQDFQRSRLVRRYFHKDIEDPLLYDAVFNAAALDYETIAAAILAVVERRAAQPAAA